MYLTATAEADKMANVTFHNNTAYNPTYPWNSTPVPKWGANHVNCFAAYGGSGKLEWINNQCAPAPEGVVPPHTPIQYSDVGVIVFHTNYGGQFGEGTIATVQGNMHSNQTADGGEVPAGFPMCTWAQGSAHSNLKIIKPHDPDCG